MDHIASTPALFSKEERLCNKKKIEQVFQNGKTEFLYPFKIFYTGQQPFSRSATLPQILFSIPKKNFKKAIDRNSLRRKLKEIYRLHKGAIFLVKESFPATIALIYISKEKLSYIILQEKLISILNRLKSIQ